MIGAQRRKEEKVREWTAIIKDYLSGRPSVNLLSFLIFGWSVMNGEVVGYLSVKDSDSPFITFSHKIELRYNLVVAPGIQCSAFLWIPGLTDSLCDGGKDLG